ncbi:tryptophan 2,3-dioxygenase [Streptomyces sp. NPDC002466]|uniref:tryptophan 2,3-dioxygenase n=1 Tax=Streptomyces sp. NPDC002466 TaxID=3364646 RepID=UPI0036CF66C2
MTATDTALRHELSDWCGSGGAEEFPYDGVIDRLRAVGKHFLDEELLSLLAECRTLLLEADAGDAGDVRADVDGTGDVRADVDGAGDVRAGTGGAGGVRDAHAGPFLDVLLDKFDDRYDYPSYTALALLRRGAPGDRAGWEVLRRHRDRTVLLLLADLIGFERLVLDGAPCDPQGMLPDALLLNKRLRLAVRVMEPAALRALDGAVDPVAVAATPGRTPAGELADAVLRTTTAGERLLLRTSVQPVYVLHDEYLFLRVLQSFEATFAFMSATLDEAVRTLRAEQPGDAAALIAAVADVLRESLPLFSLLATMQPESFRLFRQFTEGASAIQSEGYKTFESYCSTPARARLDSSAFLSVPDVRGEVLAGRETVQGTWEDVISSGWLTEPDAAAVRAAALQLEAVHQRWKQTHYRLAVRMIGTRTGTGATEGVPYLASVISQRLFPAMEKQPAVG